MKTKKIYGLGIIGISCFLGITFFSVTKINKNKVYTSQSQEHSSPPQQKYTSSLCTDILPETTSSFTTQAYRGGAYKDDSIWLMVHYKSAFTQGELACGSNSLSTALYGQKNMINRFLQELEGIEKKKGKQSNYDYIRAQAKNLQADAAKRSMNQGEWLDCYGSSQQINCRALTNIDGLEALFPDLINQVKARSNRGYTANDIYDFETGLSDGREFIDGTINLSLPLNSPERGTPRRAQNLFKEFVTRTFDAYDAQMYLAPKPGTQDPYFNNASTNPTLDTGKTLYVTYKEWLLNYKKFPAYVSNLEKMRPGNTAPATGGGNTTTTPPTTTPRQNDPTTVIAPQPSRPGDPSKALNPNGTTIISLPAKQITPVANDKTTTNVPYLFPVTSPTTSSPGTSAGTVRTLQDSQTNTKDTTPTYKYQQQPTSTQPAPSTRTLRY